MGGKGKYVPVTCIEESCQRKGVLVYGNQKMCSGCAGELLPVTDVQTEFLLEDDDDTSFSEDMIERMKHSGSPAYIDSGTGFKPVIVKTADDVFRCSPDLQGCPIAKKANVQIPISMFNNWIFLAEQLDTEWIAYLTGELTEGTENEYVIDGMYFPQQKANGAHVEAEDGEIKDRTIAAVHSHVGMNVFFSKEDQDHFNHNVELVVNRKGEILAVGRVKLECGRFHRGQADIEFIECDEQIALQAALEQVLVKETYSTKHTQITHASHPTQPKALPSTGTDKQQSLPIA